MTYQLMGYKLDFDSRFLNGENMQHKCLMKKLANCIVPFIVFLKFYAIAKGY